MDAAQAKVSLQGHAGCSPTFLSARNPRSADFVSYGCFLRNHALQQIGGVFPSLAWSADGDRWRRRCKAQEPERVLRSSKPLFSDEIFVDSQAPIYYIDVLNTLRQRPLPSEQLKLMSEECEQREKDLQQRARNFVDGIIQYILSEKEYYKFIIIACKECTNMITDLGFISCYNRDDVLNGLERIEDDIAKGRFEWIENKDVRSNIVETLVERVGEPARKLDATIIQYVQKLTILRLWFHDSADKIVAQLEQLQVELVLLALRNWGFVVPLLFCRTDWILLGELILSKVELLERDVSQLRSYKSKIDSTLLINLPLGSGDGCLHSRFSNDGSHLLENAFIDLGNMIIGDIAIDISTLEREISYWIRFLTLNDEVRESFSFLKKHVSDLSKLAAIRRGPFTSCGIQDTCQRFLAVYVVVQQILKAATDFAKIASFNQEKVQSFPSFSYIKTSGSSDIGTVKVRDKDQSEKKNDEDECARVTREFRSRSDEIMKRLIDWLAKYQADGYPLKFCQIEFSLQ